MDSLLCMKLISEGKSNTASSADSEAPQNRPAFGLPGAMGHGRLKHCFQKLFFLQNATIC